MNQDENETPIGSVARLDSTSSVGLEAEVSSNHSSNSLRSSHRDVSEGTQSGSAPKRDVTVGSKVSSFFSGLMKKKEKKPDKPKTGDEMTKNGSSGAPESAATSASASPQLRSPESNSNFNLGNYLKQRTLSLFDDKSTDVTPSASKAASPGMSGQSVDELRSLTENLKRNTGLSLTSIVLRKLEASTTSASGTVTPSEEVAVAPAPRWTNLRLIGALKDRQMAKGHLNTKVTTWLADAPRGPTSSRTPQPEEDEDDEEAQERQSRLAGLIGQLTDGAVNEPEEGSRMSSIRHRLTEFYKRYDPLRTPSDSCIQRLVDSEIPEEAIFAQMRVKYGLSGSTGPQLFSTNASPNVKHNRVSTGGGSGRPSPHQGNSLDTGSGGPLRGSINSDTGVGVNFEAENTVSLLTDWRPEWDAILDPFVPQLNFQPTSWNSNNSGSASPKTRFREVEDGSALAVQCFIYNGGDATIMHKEGVVVLHDDDDDETTPAGSHEVSAKLKLDWAERLEVLEYDELQEVTGLDTSNNAALEWALTQDRFDQLLGGFETQDGGNASPARFKLSAVDTDFDDDGDSLSTSIGNRSIDVAVELQM